MRHALPTFLVAAFLCLPQGAAAQSVITLEDFDLGGDAEPEGGTKRKPGMEECLRDPTSCDDVFGADTDFSIDDVVNLGIVDREEVAETPVSSDGTPTSTTDPLPSIDLKVLFDYNSSNIRSDQVGQLLDLAQVLRSDDFGQYKLIFLGHSDAKGSAAYNERLSQQRARSVADFVATAANLPASRIDAVGLGFQRLADPADPYSGRNRRVQLLLVPHS
jgi:outer membrane protein OmpA-like peptidoglycan-associated protein